MSKLVIVIFSLFGLINASVAQAIVQNGYCDDSISVVTQFNVNAYQGVWYDIESLPSEFQGGDCNTATYTLNSAETALNVQNTQISNGILSFATGTAVPQAGANGSAKFDVTIGTGVPPVPYWVLDTDYETFALVYSCRNNMNTNTRTINSWKLGRKKGQLPNEVNIRINNIIENVEALKIASSQFITRNHSEEACSYFVDFVGPCPTNVTSVPDFEVNRFLGAWYEVARYPQTTQMGQCNRAFYAASATTPEVYTVENSQIIDEARYTISGEARATPQPGVLAVTFPVGDETRNQDLYVLATDYKNYALLYSCANIEGNNRRIGSWQLRRNLDPLDELATNTINTAIANTPDLGTAYYQSTSQTSAACFYYPDFPENPEFIELPGQCEDTLVTGVADFNVDRYLGTWYEVARYPQTAQTGQCNRAEYAASATPGVITVVNSQVKDETRSTITGVASATNQSGVLAVNFTVGGELRTQNLHVLATDYDSYALVYSCANINQTRRRVGSWKLSRSLEPFSAEAISNISAVINNTQGLRPNLYQETSQTSAACFYYPDFPENPEVIELPGQCDTSITGVANFDVDKYLGTWYEVARYPQRAQTGQCNRAEYAASATPGVYTVLNSQVTNETRFTISGVASGTNQSGVLAVTFTVGGELRTQNLHVLATDYYNYALAYSCVNIGEDKRQVGSWKLSRSLEPFSAEAISNINAAINNTQGLRPDLYQETSQTSAACFYYPDFPENPEVIELPGQCDTSITGVPEFDVNRYLGTWYEVARYPQTAQTGQCNRAEYAASATPGVITVVNSQVTNETRSTMSGEARATNQSGVLAVTFNVSGELRTQNLHVLATDYVSYALAYSCANIGEDKQRVGSWKLSRTLEPLSEEANSVINAVISNTQGLRPDLYQETQQSEDACWYYPVQNENLPVIIPGQCDTAISGVANIDLTRFANSSVWYQISRYDPVGQRSCIGNRLTLAGADIKVNSIEVVGGQANRTESIARLSVNETGKFELELTNSDKAEIYVLATDYDNYAIAYSCGNESTTQRQIGVWLLSRTRNWPNEVNSTLQTLINNRREITDRPGYFKNIPQSTECPEPSSAFLFSSSIIVIFVCTVLQLIW